MKHFGGNEISDALANRFIDALFKYISDLEVTNEALVKSNKALMAELEQKK